MRTRVAGRDAIWLQDSPSNLMVINAIFVTDRVSIEEVCAAFRERVMEVDGGRMYARFRRRVVWQHGQPYWEDDPDFDLARHIVPAREPLPTTEALRRYVGAEAGRPLPEDRSRWQFQVAQDHEGDGTAFVVRIHHCMADGIALVATIFRLMEQLVSPNTEERRVLRPAAGAPARDLLARLALPLAAPGVLIRRLFWPADRHALHGPPLSGTKQVAWTAPLDLEVVKVAKNQLDATINDVLMACVSGAFTRFLQRRATDLIRQFHVSMPVSIRSPTAALTMENRFAAVPLQLPAGIPGLQDRVTAVKRQMDALKRSVEPIVVYGIQAALLQVLPQGVSRLLIDFLANKCTAVVTNVPGPPGDIALAGRRVRSMMFWVPQRARIGVGISILSFAGQVQIGIIADAGLVPDAMELVRDFEAEFTALRAL